MTLSHTEAGQGDLSTLAGQQRHYGPIHERLRNGRPPADTGPASRVIVLTAPAKRIALPIARSPRKPSDRVRDMINVAGNQHQQPPTAPWLLILSEVCDKHNVEWLDVCSQRRDTKLVAARNEASYRMRYETTLSLPNIGRKLGGRNHATIVHGIRRHEAMLRGETYRKKRTVKAASL